VSYKFNPFTGELDEVGSGSGGSFTVQPDSGTSPVIPSGGTVTITSNDFNVSGNSTTDTLTLSAQSKSDQLDNLTLTATVASNALTIAVKQQNGSNPSTGASAVKIGFRSSTLTSGVYNQRQVTSALSLVVSSGSTLGHSSGSAHYAYIYAIDNSGTVELAISSTLLDEGVLHTTTAEGGAGGADSGRLIYSTTARTDVPVRLIGRIRSTQATAGTWASAPSEIAIPPFSEKRIYAAYNSASSQTVASGTPTIFNYGTKVQDTHNAVTTGASWKFTAPKTGLYLVNQFNIVDSETFAAGKTFSSRLYKNGSQVAFIGRHLVAETVTENFHTYGTVFVDLVAGDYIDVRLYHDTGSDKTTEASALVNHIEILLMGEY
jgi:hypothetical protein